MGVYPEFRVVQQPIFDHEKELWYWVEERSLPGVKDRRKVWGEPWRVHERTDCFCCTCSEREGEDPYCRNHGWAARRPCETHRMPGEPGEEGDMPDSVETVRADREAARLRELEQ